MENNYKDIKGIGVHFYANKKVKAKQIISKDEVIEVYPLYVTVVYGQTNTQFKADYPGLPETILVSEDLSQLQNSELNSKLSNYESFIREAVLKEALREKERYTLVGLRKRLSLYYRHIVDAFFMLDMYSPFFLFDIFFQHEVKTKEDLEMIFLPYLLYTQEKYEITVYQFFFKDGHKELSKVITGAGFSNDDAESIIGFWDSLLSHLTGASKDKETVFTVRTKHFLKSEKRKH